MTLLDFIDYLSRVYSLPAHVRTDGKEWEVGFGKSEHSMISGKGKTLAEALAKVVEIR